MKKEIFLKLKVKLPRIKKNVSLKNFTTYKIGGLAEYFFVAKSKEDLMGAVKIAKEFKWPIFILGGGSNLLISDKGLKGLVIKMDILGIEFKGNKVYAGAGTDLTNLAYSSLDNGLSGLEWAAGIPSATIGGAVYGNAQAFGTRISDNIKNVEALDLKTLRIINFNKNQCAFSLKNSIFKKNKKLVIISVILELKTNNKKEIAEKIKEHLAHRKKGHPVNFPSAGSTFVNPEKKIIDKRLLKKYPELKNFNERGIIPAGYLIQKTGLQGKIIGGAQISPMHANFIVNIKNAKAKDVLTLIKLAQKKVKKTFGILLEAEVQFIGF